jgi:hypothetical protein
MLPLPAKSPIDGGEIVVTRFYSPQSGASVEGEFSVTMPFAVLSGEQLHFVETFVRCEGRLNRMESELGISYPTIRARLHEIIRMLGYEPGKEEPASVPEEERRRLLAELDAGRLSFDEAMTKLRGLEPRGGER